MTNTSTEPSGLKMVIFDWAGTTVDFGCFAPVATFIAAFADKGVTISPAEARGPMGLHKQDHIRTLLQNDGIGQRWQEATGQDWTEADVEDLYKRFTPRQVKEAARFTDLIPGVLETQQYLRDKGIKIGSSTGYPRAVMEPVLKAAREQGYQPDHVLCADEVPAGRPAPWMIFENMQALGVYPPSHVLKVGDTVPDISAGLNAGTWSVGFADSGSEVGLTLEEWTALPTEKQNERRKLATDKLRAAGAHDVIHTIKELPKLIEKINQKLAAGERP
ncbi:Phosphonoacetaldehyde hydrolase [Polystyrenella longa]|uniref:phosphonoacetaldehyde hydrolase n=1 Tax=Polystyrenella longa TaxID=2528007 RepID=A0A518CGI9_9PLAN|nr:phosphonoacetaldehyde hydrolase [Polystyrenella longa]QDU78348.1 Phosphonoacetaldehyde hydrolase [Polystyrenella longa]